MNEDKIYVDVNATFTKDGMLLPKSFVFIKYLSRNREVTFKYEKKQYHITIERISVYPQCFAAVASQINDLPPKVLVVDIGSYLIDDTVYEIGLEYFTQYDESGKVIKEGKKYDVIEVPEPVGVLVQKTDSTSGNVVKGAGFAVFKDAACTQRVLTDGDSGTEIPVFYYDETAGCVLCERGGRTGRIP